MVGFGSHPRHIQDSVFHHGRVAPRATALVDGSVQLTYAELASSLEQATSSLVGAGVRPSDRVAIIAEKSATSVIAILAVLGAGATVVPLDISSPPTRLARMLQIIEPAWLMADGNHEALADSCAAADPTITVQGRLTLRGCTPVLTGRPLDREYRTDPATAGGIPPAAILYTSGTTGMPKGVPLAYADLLEFVDWSNAHFEVGPGDHLSLHPPLIFDAALWDILRALTAGAALHIVPDHIKLFPTSLRDFIRESGLTHWDSVPAVLSVMAARRVLSRGDFPALRCVVSYGDVLPTAALQYWMEHLPGARFSNTYGPTETTITASYYDVTEMPRDTGSAVPIGRPVPGKLMIVLGEDGEPVLVDAIGELLIGGRGVCDGYWRDPVRTAISFVDYPPGSGQRWYRTGDLAAVGPDGVFSFHGRRDRQVKLGGRRIELDEVAAALAAVPLVADHAVVGISVGGVEGTRLCCAYVPVAGAAGDNVAVRSALASYLPSYMIPQEWRMVTAIPRNGNGKIDHAAVTRYFVGDE